MFYWGCGTFCKIYFAYILIHYSPTLSLLADLKQEKGKRSALFIYGIGMLITYSHMTFLVSYHLLVFAITYRTYSMLSKVLTNAVCNKILVDELVQYLLFVEIERSTVRHSNDFRIRCESSAI